MTLKIIGGILIICSCGWFGFSLAAGQRKEEQLLRQLIGALDYMQCELQFRMSPLPDLCRHVGAENRNAVGDFFGRLYTELECGLSADVSACVHRALSGMPELPKRTCEALELLGVSLGRFDTEGQVRELEGVRNYCRAELEQMSVNRDARLRSYQTLGLCTGAALAILFV